jgi:hypothetical protein
VTRGTDFAAAADHIGGQASADPPNTPDHRADGAPTMEAPMSPTSLRSERLILANPLDRRLPRKVTAWDQIAAALRGPEFLALVLFCALGFLATVALNLLVPNFGEITESLQPFF